MNFTSTKASKYWLRKSWKPLAFISTIFFNTQKIFSKLKIFLVTDFWISYLDFHIIGHYGDVLRVKILFNKKDTALIQFTDSSQAQTGKNCFILFSYLATFVCFFLQHYYVDYKVYHFSFVCELYQAHLTSVSIPVISRYVTILVVER